MISVTEALYQEALGRWEEANPNQAPSPIDLAPIVKCILKEQGKLDRPLPFQRELAELLSDKGYATQIVNKEDPSKSVPTE